MCRFRRPGYHFRFATDNALARLSPPLGLVRGFGPVRSAENGGGGHRERADAAGDVPVPAMLFNRLQDLLSDGQDVAALLACHDRLPLIANAAGEIF